MRCFFYVLRSTRDGDLCKGVAEDVGERLREHNAGKARSLRHRLPMELVYVEEHPTREAALAGERWAKSPAGGSSLRRLLLDADALTPSDEEA